MVSQILVNIGLDIGLSPIWHQAITLTNAVLIVKNMNQNMMFFIQGFENVISMA